jgi:hypothetical protein
MMNASEMPAASTCVRVVSSGRPVIKTVGTGEAVGEQTLMELDPGQTWHVQIGNQARSFTDTIRIKKIFS